MAITFTVTQIEATYTACPACSGALRATGEKASLGNDGSGRQLGYLSQCLDCGAIVGDVADTIAEKLVDYREWAPGNAPTNYFDLVVHYADGRVERQHGWREIGERRRIAQLG